MIYLPLDTRANARRLVELVDPAIAIFVKYEFWPNYLFELEKRSIPAILVSGLFRKDQAFFKWHGGLLRKALGTMEHYFVQDQHSSRLLAELGQKNITVSGDTRFDRVSHQIEQDNQLDFADEFVKGQLCLVGGSTWPEDMAVLLPFLNQTNNIKTILAPHTMDKDKIDAMVSSLDKKVIRYSEREGKNLADYQVLIVDTIGLLSRLYSYGDIAYVGGGMGTSGLHNILEAATFGVPIVIGKNYQKFPEAVKLEDIAGLHTVKNAEECSDILTKLTTDRQFREKTGMICGHYVNSNTGATETVMAYLRKLHADGLV
ncbi:3-deoxy-D-manno-octulosonic acid transferase [Aureitalea marina]|uniref:3-deoxy-D-manno-octulosonic acid transferase n=1 Tax=Aureitalea marina TaxID=930804 RepID=UPI0026931E41